MLFHALHLSILVYQSLCTIAAFSPVYTSNCTLLHCCFTHCIWVHISQLQIPNCSRSLFQVLQNPRKLQKLLCSVTATPAYAGSSCWLTVTALIPLGALICDTFLILHLHWTNCHCRFAVMRHSTAKNCKELQMTAKKLQRMAGQCIFITQPSEHTSYNC